MASILKTITFIAFTIALAGCGAVKSSSIASSISNRDWTVNEASPPERAYCNDPTFYSSFYTISGKAEYEYREIGIGLGDRGLKDIAEEPRPIRHAQLEIVDALGNIIQCGETDGDGNFSLRVPQNEKALLLHLYSRSNNNFNRASIFKAPETNELYRIEHSFTANSDKSNISFLAHADGDLLGGAFNILDQIHNAMDRIKELLITPVGRAPETIPKVDIYWEEGFNPGSYIGSNAGLSFFSKPQSKLFILGGLNGDTEFADTDHFDNSIILHEYFHFLESSISVSHSPGGSHSGDELLDPRLAWSEGAAQFFQALVTGIPTVFDTRGNSDGDTGFYIKYSIEETVTDLPIEDGEGEFREFAVARLLWDIFDNEDGEVAPENFDAVTNQFSVFWQAFTNPSSSPSFNNSNTFFGSAGLALEIIDSISPMNSSWGDLLFESKFAFPYRSSLISSPNPAWSDVIHLTRYAQTIEPCGLPDSFKMVTGERQYVLSNILNQNHPVVNVDHYRITIPDGPDQNISLQMEADTMTNSNGDLQMFILPNEYTDIEEGTYTGPFMSGTTISLEPGTYLIMVAIRDRASSTDDSVPAESNYFFDSYCKGGF